MIEFTNNDELDEMTEKVLKKAPKPQSAPLIRTKNVTVVPNQESLTLTWHIDIKNASIEVNDDNQLVSVIRQISIREFGSSNATQLFVLEDFNMTSLTNSNKVMIIDQGSTYVAQCQKTRNLLSPEKYSVKTACFVI